MARKNSRTTYLILFVIIVVGLYYAEKYIDNNHTKFPDISNEDMPWEASEFSEDFFPPSTTGSLVKHNYYRLSYAEMHEQAEWVAYELKKSHLSTNEIDRPYFILDDKVSSKSADWRNYKNSGYDRGHLCPAGDRRFKLEAFNETFFTSNISPQLPEFNGRTWNYLEQQVRRWAEKRDGVFVITGPVFRVGSKSIGSEKVSVPTHFFKIVLDKSAKGLESIAFLIPHREGLGSYKTFETSIDRIESETGINFLAFLEDSQERALEAQTQSGF
ncbi:MAG: DNA/RNA non-specific endonuclease [Gilvibacter sp.]